MSIFVFDANIPISMSNSKLQFLDNVLDYMEKTESIIVMCKENVDECNLNSKSELCNSSVFKEVVLDNKIFEKVHSICKNIYAKWISDNDYRVIATSVQEKADYLVTNDWALINVAKEYKKEMEISKDHITLFNPANLFWLMHSKRKDLFGWKKHIGMNLKFYHHIEMPNIYDGIVNRNWTEEMAKGRFTPYSQNVFFTINQIP